MDRAAEAALRAIALEQQSPEEHAISGTVRSPGRTLSRSMSSQIARTKDLLTLESMLQETANLDALPQYHPYQHEFATSAPPSFYTGSSRLTRHGSMQPRRAVSLTSEQAIHLSPQRQPSLPVAFGTQAETSHIIAGLPIQPTSAPISRTTSGTYAGIPSRSNSASLGWMSRTGSGTSSRVASRSGSANSAGSRSIGHGGRALNSQYLYGVVPEVVTEAAHEGEDEPVQISSPIGGVVVQGSEAQGLQQRFVEEELPANPEGSATQHTASEVAYTAEGEAVQPQGNEVLHTQGTATTGGEEATTLNLPVQQLVGDVAIGEVSGIPSPMTDRSEVQAQAAAEIVTLAEVVDELGAAPDVADVEQIAVSPVNAASVHSRPRFVSLLRTSRLSRSTTLDSPPACDLSAEQGDDMQPAALSSGGGYSTRTISDTGAGTAAVNDGKEGRQTISSGGGGRDASDEVLDQNQAGWTGSPHRLLRANPWAPLPGPCLPALSVVQHVAAVSGPQAARNLRTMDSLRLERAG